MNEDLDKVIRYVYNEFGQEFGDVIVDLKHQLQAYKAKEDKIIELITAPIDGMSLDRLGRDILQILNDKVVE